MNKKGQAAMEFLMTYGWAILVVLAAIGALAYFGVLSPDRMLPNSYTLAGGFSAGQYKVDATKGQLNLEVKNNLGSGVSNYTVDITLPTGSAYTCATNSTYVDATGLSNGASSGILTMCTDLVINEGDKFKADIKVTYYKSGESLSHTASGSITAGAEA